MEICRFSNPDTPWLELLVKFGFQNKPFVLGDWSTTFWTARINWVTVDGSPNFQFMKDNYGDSEVPVLMKGVDYVTSTLKTYLENEKDPDAYLKDWHFQNEFGTATYSLHPFFSRDFVNCEPWTTDKSENPFGDDYRFVYVGRSGSWTKFHSDVVSSHSWSANICGRKEWIMMAPGKEDLFRDKLSESGFVDDVRKYPMLLENAGALHFIQEPGEIVFVPSNWYHQVHNLTDTISINHNWVNSTNLGIVNEFLKRREVDVRKELQDCLDLFSKEEFEEKVELVLFADARLNKKKFHHLCELIRNSRSRTTSKTDTYSCERHGHQISLCVTSPRCHSQILSICTCTTTFCPKCSSFIEQLELSVASRYL